MKPALTFTAALLALWTGCALADDAPEVTPYRPTVSNPAALSAPGLLEFEAGLSRAREGGGARRLSLPYLFKYAFTENAGVLLGGDAYLYQNDPDGSHLAGAGDVTAEIKLRHGLSDSAAIGLEAGERFSTAKTGLGAEKNDYLMNGIFSADLGKLDLDVNLAYTRLGAVGDGTGRGEVDWASALSGKLKGPWGWATELSGTGQRGTSATSRGLAALNYQTSRTLVFDFGLSRDLNRHVDETVLFAGFAVLFDRH